MNIDTPIVPLPPNVIVRENPAVGFEFIELVELAEGSSSTVLIYHPIDNDSIRLFVWGIWRKRHPEWVMRYDD